MAGYTCTDTDQGFSKESSCKVVMSTYLVCSVLVRSSNGVITVIAVVIVVWRRSNLPICSRIKLNCVVGFQVGRVIGFSCVLTAWPKRSRMGNLVVLIRDGGY